MARKQTRRSISLSGATYDMLRSWCDVQHCSMSGFVEERIADFFAGVQRTARDVEKAQGTWTFSKGMYYRGSDVPKEPPPPAKETPPRGGGVHEL